MTHWLHARVYVRPPLQDTVLAERLPAVLESLPDGVDRWYFLRPAAPVAHLRLSFGGAADPLWTELLSNLRYWMTGLLAARLATRLAVDVRESLYGPAAVPGAAGVLQADSDAVLGQLRLGRARAFAIGPDVLADLGRADIARAFRREPGRPADDRDALDDDRDALDDDRDALDGTPTVPELAMLEYWWRARAVALRRYGDEVRRRAAAQRDPRLATTVLDRLLRMHGNRMLGTPGMVDR